jgi:hypothetical protein
MEINVKVKVFGEGIETLKVQPDFIDEMVSHIETALYEKYGKIKRYGQDFSIMNMEAA